VTDRSTSPIDPGLLRPVLAPLGESRSLPAVAYTSQDVFAWELAHFFEGSWVCVGRSSDLAQSGDQAAVRLGQGGVLLVRDDSGTMHGFHNVCRHRGHELLQCGTSVNRRAIRCPYHAWVYGLDGRLNGTPRFSHLPDSDPVFEGLVPARVAEWHGWVFANASGDASAFEDHRGNLDGLVSDYRPQRLIAAATTQYEIDANWKLIVENYHECYHCPQIHPELCRVTPPSSGESYEPEGLWVGGSMDLKEHADTMSLSGESGGEPLPGLSEHQRRHVFYFGLFPNLLISLHPDYVLTHRIEPISPARSRIECQWLFAPEVLEKPGFTAEYAVEFWDITNRQDWGACESVQRGASSPGYRQGPLSPEEGDVHRFLTIVANGYLQGRLDLPVVPAGSAST
jgi:glycine betaine catabolism A